MPRRSRSHAEGGVYHIMSRGVDRQAVFRDVPDHQVFIAIAREVIVRHHWTCLSYCLIHNHYHLLAKAERQTLGPGMRSLNGRFATYVNRRRGRTGHLWENRFRSVPVSRQSHLLEVVRYITLNPVRAELCDEPGDWTWSSHGALAGSCRSTIVDADVTLALFHPNPRRAREAYLQFVGVTPHVPTSAAAPCELPRPTIEELLSSRPREEACIFATIDYGYSAREVAAVTGYHQATIARWSRLEAMRRGLSRSHRAKGSVPVA